MKKKEVIEMDFVIPYKLDQHIQEALGQNPTPIQRKMISTLAEELTEQEYHELCHQLYGTKSEFDEVDGECDKPTREERYYYTVQSALYRGVFWQTLERLDFELEQKRVLERAEDEWLDPSDFYGEY